MEIKLAGEFTVQKTPEEVYGFLVDPKRFCPLLPDFESMEVVDPKNFLVKLSVGISHIRGTAAVKMTLVDEEKPRQAAYEGKGEVPGGSATIRARFQLEERSEEHTSELQSRGHLVCRLLLEKKNQ